MADTVKKSRIVSDPECLTVFTDDLTDATSLQDIINEEFNQRLKNCMNDEPHADTVENGHYDNNVTVTDVDDVTDSETPSATEYFHPEEDGDDDDGKPATARDRMFLSTDSACILFTQTVVHSPMLTPTDDSYDFLQALAQNNTKPNGQTNTPDKNNGNCDDEISEENEVCNRLESSVSDEASYEVENISVSSPLQDIKQTTNNFIEVERAVCSDEVQTQRNETPVEEQSDLAELKQQELIVIDDEQNVIVIDDEKDVIVIDEPNEFFNEKDLLEYSVISPNDIIDLTQDNEETTKEDNQTKEVSVIDDSLKEETEITNVILNEETDEKSDEAKNEIQALSETQILQAIDDILNENKEERFEVKNNDIDNTNEDILIVVTASQDDDNLEDEDQENEMKNETEEEINDVVVSSPEKTAEILPQNCDVAADVEEDTSPELTNASKCLSDFSSTVKSESSFVETTTEANSNQDKVLKKKKSKKSKKDHEKENISVCDDNVTNEEDNLSHVSVKNLCRSFSDLSDVGHKYDDGKPYIQHRHAKSSFSKFDALSKKTVLHVRSSDSGKAQEKFNGSTQIDKSCRACSKQVFQMEQIKAEKAVWHKNCFRCNECNKQLNVDTYQSNEGVLYCKPHFKALFAPKAVEDDQPLKPRKHELIIRENQPEELPPDVVRASDKPDLGLDELQNLNVKERFQVFEQHGSSDQTLERTPSTVNVKRSPSILSKLAKFQSKGMDVGVTDDTLNGVPVENSSSETEEEDDGIEGEDADLIRAKRAQREKPLHFNNMSDIMSKWESAGHQATKEERREERKQEIQSIRSRLFMGKQGKMKELYQQAVADSESGVSARKQRDSRQPPLDAEVCERTRATKEKFQRGEPLTGDEQQRLKELEEDRAVFETGISKKSRSIFLELDANASKAPQLAPVVSPGGASAGDVRRAREALMSRTTSEDIVRAGDQMDDVTVETADISNRFKFFEKYREPEKKRKQFRITPPRDGQVKMPSPEREVYRDPDVVRSEEQVDDSEVVQRSHTATKMLSIFRQMEENLSKEPVPTGPKPLKRFTPPPEANRDRESSSEEPESGESEAESDDEEDEEGRGARTLDEDLLEAQKAARAKQLRAKFEKWEANEIRREQNNSSVNIAEELADGDSQIESARSLRARFESMRQQTNEKERAPRVKVHRFVDTTNNVETCKSCDGRVYPLEKVACHNNIYHKNCFRCRECNTILRMDSYTYNQGLLYCVPHFKRLFIAKGNYESGFGLDQPKGKWNAVA